VRFRDREDAGRQLAERLVSEHLAQPIVLALPRGGVPVGAPVAEALGVPLEVFVARKVGAPHHPEYGIGAVAEGGGRVMDRTAVRSVGLSAADFDRLAAAEEIEIDRRVHRYRGNRPLPHVLGRTVILVDDGLATGVTAEAALRALRSLRPGRLVLAVPVCAPDTAARLTAIADEVVCLHAPPDFDAVGRWYRRFGQTTDAEVGRLLAERQNISL
jgi:putative phosphoribosyl transferase